MEGGGGGGCRLLNLNPLLKTFQYAHTNNVQDPCMPLIPFPILPSFDGVSSTDQSEVGLLPSRLLLVHLQLDLLVHCVQALQYL